MKRLASPLAVSRKLALRAETVAVLRQLSTHDLHVARIVGGTNDECERSTFSDPSYLASFCC